MAKCFVTGVVMPLNESYVLNIGAAYRALRDLKQRMNALERLLQQFGARDKVEHYNPRTKQCRIRLEHRLVSSSMARALSTAYPEGKLFITWSQLRARPSLKDKPSEKDSQTPEEKTDDRQRNDTNYEVRS